MKIPLKIAFLSILIFVMCVTLTNILSDLGYNTGVVFWIVGILFGMYLKDEIKDEN